MASTATWQVWQGQTTRPLILPYVRQTFRQNTRYGTPEIFNTDQGAQFTSEAFTGLLEKNGIAVSMDGRGRCQDNIFIERLWWTVKYHYIFLHSFAIGSELHGGLRSWFKFYNRDRFHQALDNLTPDEVYYNLPHPFAEAA